MGLEGYLEDLGMADILQMVSLSKKSGLLSLADGDKTGSISFSAGQIVRATSSRYPQHLGQLLCAAQLTTAAQIDAALARQRSSEKPQPLGQLLHQMFLVSQERIEEIVQQHIEKIVFSFFSWIQGRFLFELTEPQSFGATSLNPIDFILEKGICPQWFVVKGRALVDVGGQYDEKRLAERVAALDGRLDTKDIQQLRGMLAELENPFLGGGIILLILRYASELMNRAVVFDVRGRHLYGLGQFGLEAQDGCSADQLVRRLRLDVSADSIFGRVLQQQAPLCAPLGHCPDEEKLCQILTGRAKKAFVGPLVSEGRVVALLYADNYPQADELKTSRAFEVFLSQAGIAMEQALRNSDIS